MKPWQILFLLIGLSGTIVSIILRNDKVLSATVDELRKQRATIGHEIERNKQTLEKKKQEEAKLRQQIKSIEGNIQVTEQRITETQGKINDTQTMISQIITQIVEKKQELEAEQVHKKEAIQTIYETTEQNPLNLLMGSQGISEAVDRASYLEALEAKIESTIKKITELKAQLEEEKQLEEERQKAFEQLKRQQEAYRNGLQSQKKYRNSLLTETKKTQQELEQLLEEAKKAYADVNSELHQLEEAARNRGRITGPKRVGTLAVGWPITGTITTRFGEVTFVQLFHTGIDIDCIIGDSIAAAADGKITFVGGDRSYGYGIYIMIDHGEGISTLYGHLSGVEVSVGDDVKIGQVIGFCGNTGYARAFHPGGDGSHLHLEVREDRVPVNPLIYLP